MNIWLNRWDYKFIGEQVSEVHDPAPDIDTWKFADAAKLEGRQTIPAGISGHGEQRRRRIEVVPENRTGG
jgi:hypothetical protein